MSLDLYLRPKVCPTCHHEGELLDFNITYNIADMYYAACPNSTKIFAIDGMTGQESLELLQRVLNYSRKHRAALMKLEPSNGWGSYDGYVKFLVKLCSAAIEYPDSVWSSDR